jgi:hypothetical protein
MVNADAAYRVRITLVHIRALLGHLEADDVEAAYVDAEQLEVDLQELLFQIEARGRNRAA